MLKKDLLFRLDGTIHLPNLTELITHQKVLKNAAFILPELRKLTLEFSYNSYYDSLKEYKKLKYIKFGRVEKGFTQRINNSIFFFHFQTLTNFIVRSLNILEINLVMTLNQMRFLNLLFVYKLMITRLYFKY